MPSPALLTLAAAAARRGRRPVAAAAWARRSVLTQLSPRRPGVVGPRSFASASAAPKPSRADDASSAFLHARVSPLLVANRGEIACRIIRTAKRLGACLG